MTAGRFVGRVGGLAIALGVGAAVFGGAGAAWADTASAGSPGSAPDGKSDTGTKTTAGPKTATGAKTASKSTPRKAVRAESSSRPAALSSRRAQPDDARDLQVSAATPSASALGSTIVTDPDVAWVDGILRGTVGATSTRGLPLTYTVVDAPSLGGKITFKVDDPAVDDPDGQFSYLAYSSTLTDSSQNEQFSIMAAETTRFDEFLSSIPLIGLLMPSLLSALHQTPILNQLLAPIIGSSKVIEFDENPYSLADDRPVAFTTMMPSFDGTLISVNYFPAVNVSTGEATTAPLVLDGPGLGSPGETDPDSLFCPGSGRTPGLAPLRSDSTPGGYIGGGGYNVISWDPRGEHASGGILQWDSVFWEGRDTSAIISWATSSANPALSQIAMESDNDPLLGMVGPSYGGAIQLVTAGTPDKRIDAIIPTITYNSMLESLYPNGAFRTAWGSLLLGILLLNGAQFNAQFGRAVLTGDVLGFLSETSQAFLATSGSSVLTSNVDIPTQVISGTTDVLFPLQQAIDNAQQISTANPLTPVKMTWFCGGHGGCENPINPQQDEVLLSNNLKWLDQYVAGDPDDPADTIPEFQWFDQDGGHFSSDLMPFDGGFNNPDPLTYQGAGGLLGIVPFLGGSGPQSEAPLPLNIAQASEARNALNVDVPLTVGTQIVGAPNLSFTYTGIGTNRFVFAQLVDDSTGLVVGNISTPVPVTMDGRQHTVEIPMENIAYTSYDAADSLTLQITSSATAFWNFTSYGLVNISNIKLDVPTVAPAG